MWICTQVCVLSIDTYESSRINMFSCIHTSRMLPSFGGRNRCNIYVYDSIRSSAVSSVASMQDDPEDNWVTLSVVYVALSAVYVAQSAVYVAQSAVYVALSAVYVALSAVYVAL